MNDKMSLVIDAKLQVAQMNQALKSFQSNLNGLKLPDSLFKSTTKDIEKLQGHLKDFEVLTSKTQFNTSEINQVLKLYEKIGNEIKTLGIDFKSIGNIDVQKLMPDNVLQRFQKLGQILNEIQEQIDFKTNAPKQLEELSTSIDNTKNKIAELKEELNNLNQKKVDINTKQIENATELALKQDELRKARSSQKILANKLPTEQIKVDKEIERLESKVKKAKEAVDSLKNSIKTLNEKDKSTTSEEDSLAKKQAELDALREQLEAKKQLQQQLKEQQETPIEDSEEYKKIDQQIKQLVADIAKLNQEKKNLTKEQTSNDKDIKTQNEALREQEQLLIELNEKFQQLEMADIDLSKLQELRQILADIMGVNIDEIPEDLEKLKELTSNLSVEQLEQVKTVLKSLGVDLENLGNTAEETGNGLSGAKEKIEAFDQQASEVGQLKSRIQYFFGLNNAIQLVRRTMQSAFQTIQDLDKAMTETAVVTDFTVGDMWAQLPEYTKRASELGVSTQAAYEASTLYYQQGLNTQQVIAMSTETLKMARIAGLEASDATDRMTNAIRGFNMEINQMNAERVNDVYSKLAAISASNVDEISTAMTKVASLAHNANMEFETTAAFLAQIIETTRESAETAGTALKTVVARFSEVKKLVSTDQLKGQDEEGQAIDVNKVSQALRTAGIDLNKYFMGEVGLDDIFMELASKWDSLSTMQQRYIATQAAGSRQQSRFIALMSDYARMQELVGEAYNSNGAAAEQFAKTQDSLESKLARLKNAWDQFAMGILNSDVIKIGVDLLTGLLNIINNLTSGFGSLTEGLGGFLNTLGKLGVLIGGLKLGKSLLGGLTSGIAGSITKNITNEITTGIVSSLGGDVTKIVTESATKNISGGLLKGGASGAAAGLGLGGTLSIIAGIAAAAFLIYEIWLHFTKSGKLEQVKKKAEELKKEAQEAKKDLDSTKSLQDTYKEKTTEVKNATTAEDRQAAIESRNEAILNAIQENPTLAQYVITERVDDKLILTVDEDGLAKAAEEAAKIAAKAAGEASFGTADVNFQMASNALDEFQNKTVRNVIFGQIYKEYSSDLAGENSEDIYHEVSLETDKRLQSFLLENNLKQQLEYVLENSNKGDEAYNQVQEYYANLAQARIGVEQGYTDYLKYLGIDDQDFINTIVPSLGQLYLQNQTKIGLYDLQNIYENQDILNPLIQALGGTGVIKEISLLDPNINFENDNELFKSLGFDSAAIDKLSELSGIPVDDIITSIKSTKESIKSLQKNNLGKVFQNLYESGDNLDAKFMALAEAASPEKTLQILDITDTAKELLSPEEYQKIDFTQLYNSDNLDEIQDLLNSIDLNSPIDAYKKLAEAEKSATDEAKKYITAIRESNKELLSATGLVQSFLTSTDYESLTDQLEDFIEANGSITADNIEELAESNKTLNDLLETGQVNALGLANALTLVETGKLAFDNITDSLLASLSVGKDFTQLLSEVDKWIEQLGSGRNFASNAEEIISNIDEIMEQVTNWEFGNESIENLYDSFFGPDAYKNFMAENGRKSGKEIEELLTQDFQRIKDLFDNDGLKGLQELFDSGFAGLTKGEGLTFDWDLVGNYENTTDFIQELAKQLGITEEAAEAFVEVYKSHDYDFKQEFNELNYQDQLKAFAQSINGAKVVTEQELAALGESVGKKAQQVQADLNSLGIEIPIVVNWQDANGNPLTGTNLVNQFKQTFGETPDYVKDLSKPIYRGGSSQGGGVAYTGIDYDALMSKLQSEGGLPQAQAEEMANEIVGGINNALLTKTITVPKYEIKDGVLTVTPNEVVVEGSSVEELELNADAIQAQAAADKVGALISNINLEGLSDQIQAAIESGAQNADIQAIIDGKTYTINAQLVATGGEVAATGGIVGSYASGTRKLKPGPALTGEEAPEIVWNKEKGYAYITGAHGPQFQNLKPGDQVFNGDDTKKILSNSFSATKIGSYQGGSISQALAHFKEKVNALTTKDGGGGSSSKKSSNDWKNELDWLYDLMEDIAEEEHKQTLIQSEYELAEKDLAKTGKDLFNLTKSELEILQTQLSAQQFAFEKRLQQMNELQQKVNAEGFQDYLQWNPDDNTLEIDWDKINEISDKDTYDKLSELVSDMEKVQDQMDDAQKATLDIKKQIQELQTRYLQAYLDFQDRVMEAVVAQYQQNIDALSTLNDTINDANQSILDSIQKEIDLQRQIRDNTDTEKEIADIEAQLAFLSRDTTGANDQQIRELQKQLDEARKNYSDTLVDQAIDRLSQNNDDASTQREKQIELLQAQLEYWQETGALWGEVADLIATGFTPEGSIIEGSALWDFLKDKDSWQGLSQAQKENWANELILQGAQVGAYLTQLSDGADVSANRIIDSIIGDHGLAGEIKADTQVVRAMLNEIIATIGGTPIDSIPGEDGYASGGLNTKTGLAMLHGTRSEPEYVLNARQTDAFLQLADVLPAVFSGNGITNSIGGNVYVDLTMNVGEIGSDYDVDRMVARVKEDIYSAATYRNVNAVSFLR